MICGEKIGGAGNPWPTPPPFKREPLFLFGGLAGTGYAVYQYASGNTGTAILMGALSIVLMYLSGLYPPESPNA